jgi:hypothetical protein
MTSTESCRQESSSGRKTDNDYLVILSSTLKT